MNETLVNNPIANLPSYDAGICLELENKNLSFKTLLINTKNSDGKVYNYYALQLGYELKTLLGAGSYRAYGFTTNKRFSNWEEVYNKERLQGFGISLDQKFSENLGTFARFGWQDDNATVDYDRFYSIGLNINGKLWKREENEIGIGYSYLEGTDNSNIDNSFVLEGYIRFQLTKFSNLTLDCQYVKDEMKNTADNRGIFYGVRVNLWF
jgi:porin